ncbi:hypothetical protein CM19_08155 [Candidatus Acidianus copahuensis]|uniref:HEPN domain-containing protein n=1 Tax=Candidatus Acidianus copahuensis TaxID=1160895 RepID=A0A031LNG2_9CREN|nr:HEPN domain-containing protein [Candidatus Acidianus copahuensis]EZQ04955.1 hypothetical protein CM19_08155 [Candidatus Acidianus copahuensis]
MELISKGEESFELAKMSMEKGVYWLVCFLSHQSVELVAKGKLYIKAGSFPFTHNICTLIRLLGNPSQEVLDACEFLNPHYTASRYSQMDYYSKNTAELCMRNAEVILSWLKTL